MGNNQTEKNGGIKPEPDESSEKQVENLLWFIAQGGGQIKIENGQLLVSPVKVARQFGQYIKRLKPEILISQGYCPICAAALTIKSYPARRAAYCLPPLGCGKYNSRQASPGKRVKDLAPEIQSNPNAPNGKEGEQ